MERDTILRRLVEARSDAELARAIRAALAYAKEHRDETVRLAVEPFLLMALGRDVSEEALGLRTGRSNG